MVALFVRQAIRKQNLPWNKIKKTTKHQIMNISNWVPAVQMSEMRWSNWFRRIEHFGRIHNGVTWTNSNGNILLDYCLVFFFSRRFVWQLVYTHTQFSTIVKMWNLIHRSWFGSHQIGDFHSMFFFLFVHVTFRWISYFFFVFVFCCVVHRLIYLICWSIHIRRTNHQLKWNQTCEYRISNCSIRRTQL